MAKLYQSQGKYTEAEPLLIQALAIYKEQLGENHPSTATSLNNLAALYYVQGKYTEAEPLYQQALAITKEQLGENHPSTATILNNLATSFWGQNNIPQTINYLSQGTDIEENLLQQNLIGSDAQKQAYFATFSATTDATISLHQQVASLNLSGTKLVVLSACKTGLGDVRNGDGVYGLRRALVLAGSETQLISLWDVSDNVTEQLMSQYYQQLMENEGRHQALREIQLDFLNSEEYNHPYFWAAFIPSGNWRSMKVE
ncbi:Kinesin light chain [Crocosphaera watsonii WH 0402]|uniref:Kinesin light chain n=1 Tax=Crocosphaera watsonii WH 0402 TaxID=1284629 RepID=T2JX91_CROWT|nr:Kinesin light chain [Crocosphaera watsonii WH 0402]